MRCAARHAIWMLLTLAQLHCGTAPKSASAPVVTTPDDGNTVGYAKTSCTGVTPLLRLSQAQYRASVRDIFHVTLPALDLPQDDSAGPFAANYATSVTDLGIEQYQAAASAVAALVVAQQVLPCDPDALDVGCVTQFVNQLGRQVLRRPLTDAEAAQYGALVASYVQAGDANTTVSLLTRAFLQSPWFLYRVETGTATPDPNVRALGSYELATRMAYLLWGSTPDAALLTAADDNTLLEPAVMAQEANRMLADPRFTGQMTAFFTQLLALNGLSSVTRDPNLFPAYSPGLEAAMARETGDFVTYVMTRDDARLETFLTAPYSVVTGPLASLYGVPASTDGNDRVDFDPAQRAGLLTQAAFLTAHAHGNAQPAAVLRGKVVRENLLCQAMPAPPPNVVPLSDTVAPDATARQIFAAHESNASCAACHKLMDPIGLSFETYDNIGTYRTREGNSVIDPSGYITGSLHSDVTFTDVIDLSHDLALSADVHTCVVGQAMRFGLSRELTSLDACAQTSLVTAFDAGAHDMRDLMFQIVTAPTFRNLGLSQ